MKNKNIGFTLIELMIVIAILGVLASIGYPAYSSYVKKGNRADGIDSLVSLAGRMEEVYMVEDSYTNAAVASANSSDGLYSMAIATQNDFTYSLTATPVQGDPECGVLTLTSLGVKTAATGSANCW